MRIQRYEAVAGPDDPDFFVHELESGLWAEAVREAGGVHEAAETPRGLWAQSLTPRYLRRVSFVAFDDEPVGVASVELPQEDNRSTGYVTVAVDAAHRRRGIGAALFDEAEALARADGRTILQAWTNESMNPSGEHLVRADEGDGLVDAGAAPASFLLARGFRLMQVETISVAELATPRELEAIADEARAATSRDYEIVVVDEDPLRFADDLALLYRAMSVDVPMGGASLEEEEFDAERLERVGIALAHAGLERSTVAVRHRPSGRLVAFTVVRHDPSRPAMADQWETLVLGEHRGRGLGWFMKAHSHALLRRRWPHARRIATGNASENGHMLAINRRLGYVPAGASGLFERRS